MTRIIRVLILCIIIGITAFFAKGSWNGLNLAEIVRAAELYYEVKIKLTWDLLYNLDLYVEEPSGDVVSPSNTISAIGAEFGYYDSEGEWHVGDSGDNTAPEVYRAEYESTVTGVYDIYVFCNQLVVEEKEKDREEEERTEGNRISELAANIDIAEASTAKNIYYYDVSANAFVHVTLHDDSPEETFLRFPESGTVEVASDVNDGWWHAGSFIFVPAEEEDYPWYVEDPTECFIATAIYGSTLAPEIQLLCSFRDTYLSNNTSGRFLLKIYHEVSPTLAKGISRKRFLKAIVRSQLNPLIKLIKLFHSEAPS